MDSKRGYGGGAVGEVIWWRDDDRQAILVEKVYDGGTYVGARTLYNKTAHRQVSRGCGDLFVWFGGPYYNTFLDPVIC